MRHNTSVACPGPDDTFKPGTYDHISQTKYITVISSATKSHTFGLSIAWIPRAAQIEAQY